MTFQIANVTLFNTLTFLYRKDFYNFMNTTQKITAKAILVVSFGTSYHDTREKTIDCIEQDIAQTFLQHRIYRAWTS